MSSYLVLARKYRPRTFDEVIGQESVTRVLRGAIEEGRIGHAYLFAGPRGTGKTTIARVLAKCLNCEQGPTPTPCGTCERCVAADTGSEVDIIELDAASHTGVDTIRELRDEVVYAPMRARHKVYIVDEVHMLSKAAFNALLKTLEEPPPHVVFLFATTEPHKVLDTILSRCQVLRLSSLSEERIAARLDEVFRLEGVEPEAGVVAELSRSARGGMRDALSLADKLLALAGSTPTLEDLKRLGGSGVRQIEDLLQAIEAGDRARVLQLLAETHGDETQLAAGLLDTLRTCLVLHHCGAEAPFVQASASERAAATARATNIGPQRLELWMQVLLRARERMRLLSDQSGLVLEVALLDLCRDDATLPVAELVQRLEALENGLPAPAPSARPVPKAAPSADSISPAPPPPVAAPVAAAAPPASAPPPRVSPPPAPRAGVALATQWTAFLAELGKTHGALAMLLEEHSGPRRLTQEGADEYALRIAPLDAKGTRVVQDRRNAAACSRALSTVLGAQATLGLVIEGAGGPAAGGEPRGTGAPERDARAAGRTQSAASDDEPKKKSKDALTEKVADLFGGVIEDVS